MKVSLIFLSAFLIFFKSQFSFSQRILFQSDFENISLAIPDSIPMGWKKLDADSNFFGLGKSWAVRDTNQILGGDTVVNRPRSHSGKKSLHISWFAGKGGSYLCDDWVWTDSLRIANGDSLIFWALLGNTEGISFYVDSVQIWSCSAQTPSSAQTHIATIRSNLDTNYNVWREHKFSLSQFAGQKIYIAFRYYIPVQNALWCNIDDLFIGNMSGVGISQIGTNIPDRFYLYQNYPNPFNPKTIINYEIPSNVEREKSPRGVLGTNVKLIVYNVLGNEVAVLVNENQNAGSYSVDFDANLSSGIYFYKLTAGDFSDVKKMTLIK